MIIVTHLTALKKGNAFRSSRGRWGPVCVWKSKEENDGGRPGHLSQGLPSALAPVTDGDANFKKGQQGGWHPGRTGTHRLGTDLPMGWWVVGSFLPCLGLFCVVCVCVTDASDFAKPRQMSRCKVQNGMGSDFAVLRSTYKARSRRGASLAASIVSK
jgi:hypothetical protein